MPRSNTCTHSKQRSSSNAIPGLQAYSHSSSAERALSIRSAASQSGTSQHAARLLLLLLFAIVLAGCGSRNTTGRTGYREDIPPSPKGSAIVRTAKTATGKPYHWGGCSPSQGFDCSGLVWWAFHENGLSVPRTTDKQTRAGQTADCDRLRLGDVLVFAISSKGLHSGIYSGNGNFIHSPKSGHVVREEALQKDYWLTRLLTCRRIAP